MAPHRLRPGVIDSSFAILTIFSIVAKHLDTVGNKAEDGSKPEEHRKAREEAFAELHPLRHRGGRRQGVRSVFLEQNMNDLILGKYP